jgi:AraC-like DNA-binding protein
MSSSTVPIRYLAEIADRSGPRSRGVAGAIAAAGLSRDALRRPRLRVTVAQVKAFYEALRRATDDELFGYFERPVPVGAYASLLWLLTGMPDLALALEGMGRFYRVFDRHAYLVRGAERRLTTLTMAPRDRDQSRSIFFTHGLLLTAWRTLTWLSGRDLELAWIELPGHFRSMAQETRFLFGAPPRFGTRAAIAFATDHLRHPVARRPDEADAYRTQSLDALLMAPRAPTLEAKLRAILAAGAPSVVEAARELGLSRAVLARRLQAQGVSFQQVKDEVRRDHAIGLLTGTQLSVAAISERLGYSAPTAFQRAFRSWTGASPGALRRVRRARA